jgi:DMSO reductase family type II enzyme chaperone
LDAYLSGEYFETLHELAADLGYPSPFDSVELDAVLADLETAEISTFFTSCFESGNPSISLRESSYSNLTEKALLEEVLRFYDFFGLNMSEGGLRELPDNLPVELEFMQYLCYLEQGTLDNPGEGNNLTAIRRAQRDFVKRHLGTLASAFADKFHSSNGHPFYSSMAAALSRYIVTEKAYLEELCGDRIVTLQD